MARSKVAQAILGAAGTATLGVLVSACAASVDDRVTSPEEPMRSNSPAARTFYQDGVYEATGWYGSLPSHHDVTLTIENETVIAVEITTPADDEVSLGYQARFAAALPSAIVGRDVDDIDIDRLSGSSGCSQGFMDALAKIKRQAR